MNGGGIKIRGEDIVVDADNDLTLTAGNNIKIKADNKVEIKAEIANCHAKLGNLCGDKMSFMGGAFASTYVQAAAIAAGSMAAAGTGVVNIQPHPQEQTVPAQKRRKN